MIPPPPPPAESRNRRAPPTTAPAATASPRPPPPRARAHVGVKVLDPAVAAEMDAGRVCRAVPRQARVRKRGEPCVEPRAVQIEDAPERELDLLRRGRAQGLDSGEEACQPVARIQPI